MGKIIVLMFGLSLMAFGFQNCGDVNIGRAQMAIASTVGAELCTMPPTKINKFQRILFFVDQSQSMMGIDPPVNASGVTDLINGTTKRVDALRKLISQYATDDNFTIAFAELKDNTATFTNGTSAGGSTSCNFFKPKTDMSAINNILDYEDQESRVASGGTAFKSFYDHAVTCIQSDSVINPSAYYSVVLVTDGAANDITPQQNFDAVKFLIGLGKSSQEAIEMSRVNVFYYFLENFNTNPDASILMSNIIRKAQLAGGNRSRYMVKEDGSPLDYSQIGLFNLIKYRLKRFFASNMNMALSDGGLLAADSDGDGVADIDEQKKGTNPQSYASGGITQLCSDFVWLKNGGTCQTSCVQGQQYADTDHDGLNDCDETAFGTDSYNFDSDGDYIPDGLEVRIFSNPLAKDADDDENRDGLTTLDEAYIQTNTLINNNAARNTNLTNIQTTFTGERNGQNCYNIVINTLPLFNTLPVNDTISGWEHGAGGNLIKFMFLQVPEDDSNGEAILLYSDQVLYYSDFGPQVKGYKQLNDSDFKLYERPME